ncbi:MAG: AI-2E family transporter [bacterium]
MEQKVKIDISVYAILKILAVLVIIAFLYVIRDILLLLFIVIILVAAFRPVIRSWQSKIGKAGSITLFLIVVAVLTSGFFYLIVPPFVTQTKQLIDNTPDLLAKFSFARDHSPTFEKFTSAIYQSLGNISNSVLNFTAGLFGGIFTFFTAFILMIYLLIDEVIFKKIIKFVVPPEKKELALDLVEKISQKIGSWFRGQMILGFVMGLLTYIGLSIIGVKYAIILAVIAGVLEIVPFFGPLIAGALACLVAVTTAPISAVFVAALAILLNQLENNFLVPKIMQKAIGLPPAIIIIAILIGGKLLGVLGALLAAPISGIIYVIIQEWDTLKDIANRNDS